MCNHNPKKRREKDNRVEKENIQRNNGYKLTKFDERHNL